MGELKEDSDKTSSLETAAEVFERILLVGFVLWLLWIATAILMRDATAASRSGFFAGVVFFGALAPLTHAARLWVTHERAMGALHRAAMMFSAGVCLLALLRAGWCLLILRRLPSLLPQVTLLALAITANKGIDHVFSRAAKGKRLSTPHLVWKGVGCLLAPFFFLELAGDYLGGTRGQFVPEVVMDFLALPAACLWLAVDYLWTRPGEAPRFRRVRVGVAVGSAVLLVLGFVAASQAPPGSWMRTLQTVFGVTVAVLYVVHGCASKAPRSAS